MSIPQPSLGVSKDPAGCTLITEATSTHPSVTYRQKKTQETPVNFVHHRAVSAPISASVGHGCSSRVGEMLSVQLVVFALFLTA